MSSLLTAAITALVTTLAVSFLIGPRLEARNRRIQEAHKGRDQFHQDILTLLGQTTRLRALRVPDEATPAVVKALNAERMRWTERLDETTRRLIDTTEQFAGTYLPFMGARDLAIHFALTTRLLWLSERILIRKLELLHELASHAEVIYVAAWWRKWRLPESTTALRQLIEDIAENRR